MGEGAAICLQRDCARSREELGLEGGKREDGGALRMLGGVMVVASSWAVEQKGETWTDVRAVPVWCSQGPGESRGGKGQGQCLPLPPGPVTR